MKEWIDDHREFILLLFVLPIGKIMGTIAKIKYILSSPKVSEHDNRVERLRKQIAQNRASEKPMRTDRMGNETLETRSSDKSNATIINVKDMRRILCVNEE